MFHLNLQPVNHKGDVTHTDTEEAVGEVTPAQRQFMVQHTLRHRRDRVKTQTRNTSATASTAVFVNLCVCTIVHADVCSGIVTGKQQLTVPYCYFKPELWWFKIKLKCVPGFVHSAHLSSSASSSVRE